MSELSYRGGGVVGLSSRPPRPPSDSTFAIQIDFQKGAPNPARVFQAADAIIRALQALDHTLCVAVDPLIEPVMMLEDIEAGSLRIWLAEQLKRVDDEAIKTLEWKPIIGKYLLRAKYAYLKWSNKEGKDSSLLGLAREIRTIARETDIRHVPDYAPPSIQELAAAARKIDEAKDLLQAGDKMSYIEPGEPELEFNLEARWSDEDLSALSVGETTKFESMPLILIVKRPDYLGNSKWDFRQGRKTISAKIDDREWLESFQSRNIDIRPGDALRCLVTMEHKYGFDNELISEDYTITKVEKVMENQARQPNLGLE